MNRGEWSVDDDSPRGREAERQDDNWVRKGTGCVMESAHGEKAREKRKGIGTRQAIISRAYARPQSTTAGRFPHGHADDATPGFLFLVRGRQGRRGVDEGVDEVVDDMVD